MSSHQPWNESETHCKSYNGNLAAFKTSQELAFAQNLCAETISGTGCWVGGRGVNSTIGLGWNWSDNTSYWNESLFPGEPLQSICSNISCHTNSSIDVCILVTNGSTSLLVERCNMSHAFICMVDLGIYSVTSKSLCTSILHCLSS